MSTEGNTIDGKKAAHFWQEETRQAILAGGEGNEPRLKVILVGDHPASRAYVTRKARIAEEVGIDAELIRLDENTSTRNLVDLIDELNQDPLTHGILVQLPLPGHCEEAKVLKAIDPRKDVDGFHALNVGRLHTDANVPSLLTPCTPMGCIRLLRDVFGDEGLGGKTAAIIGRSNIVGKPMAALLLAADCTVMHLHSRTAAPEEMARQADILVAAVGRPHMIGSSWVKDGAVVIDVGINRVPVGNGKTHLVGDVDFDEVAHKVRAITPVPGGVGPMTVAGLMHNTLLAARAQSADENSRAQST
ncbi:MAG: bifunctional 5,10-methylenetetrahydrofolate dehydrogenase/5,10-methenyltetrahydrofolate cyclohydrolase [Pseudomonadota bacterium]